MVFSEWVWILLESFVRTNFPLCDCFHVKRCRYVDDVYYCFGCISMKSNLYPAARHKRWTFSQSNIERCSFESFVYYLILLHGLELGGRQKTTTAATNKAMHNEIMDEEKKNTESDKLNGDE